MELRDVFKSKRGFKIRYFFDPDIVVYTTGLEEELVSVQAQMPKESTATEFDFRSLYLLRPRAPPPRSTVESYP